MLPYILGFGLAAGLFATIIPLVNANEDKAKKIWAAFFIAGIATIILMWLVIVIGIPTFAHWSDSGPTIGLYLALIMAAIVGGIAGHNKYDNKPLWWIIVIFTIVGVVRIFPVEVFQMGIGPNPCSVPDTQAALNQLLTFENVASLDDVQESSVEKISGERSLMLARNAQPQNMQLGEYLVVDQGYEQLINGRPMNVHPLKPKDIAAYGRFGNITPGYLLVDASRTDGYSQWVGLPEGSEIYYISSDAWWKKYNLERYVYFHYALPKGVQVWDIQGPEVNDTLEFWYVGTVMKPSVAGGARYYMPVGIITIHPHTGVITPYTIEEAREQLPWLDRILPVAAAKTLVADYAKYQDNAAVCNIITDSGQWEIDEDPIITTRGDEQVMQFFVTTLNDEDPIVQEVIYISPKSMIARRFPGNGMLVTDKTRSLVEKRANPNMKPELYSVMAREPTHMWFGGEQFMVYVLERGTTFTGFGAIRSDLARKENDQFVILAETIGELSRRAIEQNASIKPGSLDNQVAEAAFEVRVEGVVEFIGTPYMDAGDLKVIFTVRENGTSKLYQFRANSRLLAEKLIGVGHEVTVTGQAISEDLSIPVDVSTIVNESYPGTQVP